MFFIHMGGRTNIFYKQRDTCLYLQGGGKHLFMMRIIIENVSEENILLSEKGVP